MVRKVVQFLKGLPMLGLHWKKFCQHCGNILRRFLLVLPPIGGAVIGVRPQKREKFHMLNHLNSLTDPLHLFRSAVLSQFQNFYLDTLPRR
jgi:hypothetical protein